MNDERIFYIYIYLDPRKPGLFKYGSYEFKYEPFYVGKGNGKRCDIINNRTCYFKNKINRIKESGLEPLVIKLKEDLGEEQSFVLEFKLIKLIGRRDLGKGPLVNFTNGGEGTSGRVCTEETRELMKKNHVDVKGEKHPMFGVHRYGSDSPMFGKKHSEETKRRQSEKMKGENNPMFGKYHSKETKKLMRENHVDFKGENGPFYGKHHSRETKKLIREKKKGIYPSEETKRKQSEKKKGKYLGEDNPNSTLTKKKIIKIWKYLNEGVLTQREIAKKFNVCKSIISMIKTGKRWSHIKMDNLEMIK